MLNFIIKCSKSSIKLFEPLSIWWSIDKWLKLSLEIWCSIKSCFLISNKRKLRKLLLKTRFLKWFNKRCYHILWKKLIDEYYNTQVQSQFLTKCFCIINQNSFQGIEIRISQTGITDYSWWKNNLLKCSKRVTTCKICQTFDSK